MTGNRICIIGSGATAIYTLKHFLTSPQPLEISVFESARDVGRGMPYRSDMNAEYMLCNAFSREIPRITRTLIEWLEQLPARELDEWELSTHDLSARAFYPRLLIGEFLADEFVLLCQKLRNGGHHISITSNARVADIAVTDLAPIAVSIETDRETRSFDHVVIATGHAWPLHPVIDQANLVSPWPYTNVTSLTPGNIGILGSSLSAIDIVVALGSTHGVFHDQNGSISWQPNENASDLKITMVSKDGIMPEGDFYYPYPYIPLETLTPEAVDAEVGKGSGALLQRVFDLLCREFDHADPGYLDSLGPAARTVEGFAEAYFQQRKKLGAQASIKADFSKARQSVKRRETIASRHVLLRAHENFDRALRALDGEEWALFAKTLLPVFADSYAAVPHLSLARVIAMFDANVLSLRASGDDGTFTNSGKGGVCVSIAGEKLDFDVMIDARGQASAPLDALPFPSLVKILADKTEPLTAPFKLRTQSTGSGSIYCLALPQILGRHPFSQGLSNMAENGRRVAAEILSDI